MSGLLIIGYGNPLRGDDGIGWRLANELDDRRDDGEVEYLSSMQLTPELALPISHAEEVWFLDAEQGESPGAIACRKISSRKTLTEPWTHDVSPECLLRLAEDLYDSKPQAILLTISGESFDLRESFSPAVQKSFETLSVFLLREIASIRDRKSKERPDA